MNEGTVGIVIFVVISVVSAMAAHASIRRVSAASVLSAMTASLVFHVGDTLHRGHMDKFALVTIVFGFLGALIISLLIGLPFELRRQRGTSPARAVDRAGG